MKATIYSHETPIGVADLQIGDRSMGHVYGEFIPNDEYYKSVQKHVWEFWLNNKPDYIKWHSLQLNVRLENNYLLFPEGGITIDDLEELQDEPKRIDIAGVDLSKAELI
jgi:hypothetical protein